MSFGQAVSSFFSNYANFQGRTRRSGYWWVVLFVLLVTLPLFFVDQLFTGFWPQNLLDSGFGPVSLLFLVAVAIPSLSVGVRRLHDTNRSGWWIILPGVTGLIQTLVNLQIAGADGFTDPMVLLTSPLSIGVGFLTLAASIVLFVFYVLDSTPGDNQYGPNPKGVDAGGV